MREIPLTQGRVAIVDDDDYELLSKSKWYYCKVGYACRDKKTNGKRKALFMHRVITNCPDNREVDHINRDRLDNRKVNLRVCTRAQNGSNIAVGRRRRSQYKGLYWDRSGQKWRVELRHLGRKIYIGQFDSETEAALHYNEAASTYHGEFAFLNAI